MQAGQVSSIRQKEDTYYYIFMVAPSHQHHGLAEHLMKELIEHAKKNDLMLSLETHNPQNVPFL